MFCSMLHGSQPEGQIPLANACMTCKEINSAGQAVFDKLGSLVHSQFNGCAVQVCQECT